MKATEGRAADVWHLVSVQGPAKVPFRLFCRSSEEGRALVTD